MSDVFTVVKVDRQATSQHNDALHQQTDNKNKNEAIN